MTEETPVGWHLHRWTRWSEEKKNLSGDLSDAMLLVEPLIRADERYQHDLANGGCVPADAYRDAEIHIREIAQEIAAATLDATFMGPSECRGWWQGIGDAAKIARGIHHHDEEDEEDRS